MKILHAEALLVILFALLSLHYLSLNLLFVDLVVLLILVNQVLLVHNILLGIWQNASHFHFLL